MTIHKINLSGHENEALSALGFTFVGTLQVDLADTQLFDKVVTFLKGLNIGSGDSVILCPPGLAPLSILVVTALHGLTGQFPSIQPLVRDNATGKFVPVETSLDLQVMRNEVARINRPSTVVL